MTVAAVTLEGGLVRLEPLARRHVAGLVAASSPTPAAFRWNVVPVEAEAMGAYVEQALEGWEQGHMLAFATVRRHDGCVLGSTRFARIEHWPWPPGALRARPDGSPDVVEIGYTWLAPHAQRTGINTEVKRLMLAHAFEVWRVHRVSLITDRRNDQSRTAIARLGAQFEGVIRADRIGADGAIRDSARFSIVADEWPAVRDRLDGMLAAGRTPSR